MTTGELGAIVSAILGGLGGVGGVIRWGILRITNVIENNSNTMLKFVESAARLEVKLDQAHAASLRTQAAVEEVADEVTGNHELVLEEEDLHLVRPPPFARPKTPAGGYQIVKRKGTRS